MLKIRFSDNRQPPFWAMEKNFTIGSAKSNHLTLEEPNVAGTHARIIQRGETFVLKDLGSEQGTFVNDTRISKKNIACGDKIRIGETTLEIIDPFIDSESSTPWSLIADSSWLSGQEFPLETSADKNNIVLGRSSDCDIVIPGTHLSRQHAEIRVQGGDLQIHDLGSSNGTFVNDTKVRSSRLRAGDRLRLDVYSFKVFGPGIALPRAATQTLKVISNEVLSDEEPQEKLWATRSTSPGNRTQIDLYKKHWFKKGIPIVLAAIVLLLFCAVMVFTLFIY